MTIAATDAPMPTAADTTTAKFQGYASALAARRTAKRDRAKRHAEYESELVRRSNFVRLNGTVHHYFDSGDFGNPDCETVILIHGWDCWWMWWHHVIKALNAQGIRTVAYDLKGHGWSDEDAERDYSLASLSQDLQALVQHLGLKRYHIASFSLGCFVALDYAVKFESQIKSLTFFNFGTFPNSPLLSKLIPKVIPFIFDKVLRRVTWWVPVYIYARLTLARNPASREDIEIVGMQSIKFCSSEAVRQTAAQLAKMEVTGNLPKQVESLQTPMLFVAGKGDQVVSWKQTKALFGYAAHGRFELIKKCGHIITLELPAKAAELIASQVQSTSAPAGALAENSNM